MMTSDKRRGYSLFYMYIKTRCLFKECAVQTLLSVFFFMNVSVPSPHLVFMSYLNTLSAAAGIYPE